MTLIGEQRAEDTSFNRLAPGEMREHEVKHATTASGHRYERRFVAVGDESTPEDRARVKNQLDLLNDMVVDNAEWPAPSKGVSNPASDLFYQSHLTGTTLQHWRDDHMPSALALYPLQRLQDAGRMFPNGIADDYAMDIYTNAIDSIAIRARGSIHNALLLKKAAESTEYTLSAVALGAGAGVPNINATTKVRDELGKKIHWREYDTSYRSLEVSKELFEEAGIPKQDVETHRADYKKAFHLAPESVDIIDMLGLWEYLSTSRCEEAVHELYKLLKPGGIFIASNMLLDRPQLDLNQRVVGWPGVKPRSIDDLIDIAAVAGIDTDSITVTTSDDGVYAVMEIHKP